MSNFAEINSNYQSLILKQNITLKELEHLKKTSLNHLSIINENLQTYVQMFNNIISDLSDMLAKDFPYKIDIKTYAAVINNIILTNKSQLISLFVVEIYINDIYRSRILAGDEQFFEENKFDKIEKKNIQIMSLVKSCWSTLNQNKKEYIKNATKMLVNVTEEYIKNKDDGNELQKIIIWTDRH